MSEYPIKIHPHHLAFSTGNGQTCTLFSDAASASFYVFDHDKQPTTTLFGGNSNQYDATSGGTAYTVQPGASGTYHLGLSATWEEGPQNCAVTVASSGELELWILPNGFALQCDPGDTCAFSAKENIPTFAVWTDFRKTDPSTALFGGSSNTYSAHASQVAQSAQGVYFLSRPPGGGLPGGGPGPNVGSIKLASPGGTGVRR